MISSLFSASSLRACLRALARKLGSYERMGRASTRISRRSASANCPPWAWCRDVETASALITNVEVAARVKLALKSPDSPRELLGKVQAAPVASSNIVAVTASAGVATYPYDGVDAGSLLQAADQALYASKRSGRNTVRSAEQARATQTVAG